VRCERWELVAGAAHPHQRETRGADLVMVSSGAATLDGVGGVIRGVFAYVGLAVVVVLDGVEGGSLTTSALAALMSDALVRASVVVSSIPDGVGVVVRGSTCAGGIEGEWWLPLVSTAKETLHRSLKEVEGGRDGRTGPPSRYTAPAHATESTHAQQIPSVLVSVGVGANQIGLRKIATRITCTDGDTTLTSLREGRRDTAVCLRCREAHELAFNHPQTCR